MPFDIWMPPKPAIIIPASKEALAPRLDPRVSLGLTMMARMGMLRNKRLAVTSVLPTFVALGTVAEGSTSLSIPYYAGLAANDIAFVWAGAASTPTIGTITDFTSLAQVTNGSVSGRLAWKRLVGDESGSVTCATTGGFSAVGAMIGIRGAIASGTPYEAANSQNGSGASTIGPAITTLGPARMALRFGFNESAQESAGVPSGGWVERLEFIQDSDSTIDTLEVPSATTVAASTRSGFDTGPWVTQVLAVIPA